jgi:hypothetical protein
MGNEGTFKGVAGEWRCGQEGLCLKSLTTPDIYNDKKNISECGVECSDNEF